MKIKWYGQSYFQILSQRGKDKQISIAIDPFSEEIGLHPPKIEADILLITHDHSDHNNKKVILSSPFIIEDPGEYEIKEVFIQGISAFHDELKGQTRGKITIYTIEIEGISLCHLGDLGQSELTTGQLEKIGQVDILMIPVGGKFTISAKEAVKVMSQIEPKIIIPMHYALPKLKTKLDGVNKFLKTLGIKSIEALSTLSVKKRDLSEEEVKITVLKPS